MQIRPAHPRRGITLLEVLAAIFIMGVGLLSLLTLFPLGALSMGRGVRDDRAAAIAASASGMAQVMGLNTDANVVANLNNPPQGGNPVNPQGSSYPVLVDPFYANLGQNTFGTQQGTPGIRRCSPTYLGASAPALWFSFLDEIQFDASGAPDGSPNSVNRPGTYTWSYLVKQSNASQPNLVDLSVIVYANRAIDVPGGETTPAVDTSGTYNPGANVAAQNSINLTYAAGSKPNVHKGTWIMDVTYVTDSTNTYGTVNGYCYRVAAVNETSATTMTVEVEPALFANVSNVVVMENVIAVVPRGTFPWSP